MRLRRLVPLACGLTLLGTTAIVFGSSPKPSGSTPVAECPTPDKSKCLSAGYIETKCGRQHKSVCEPHVIAAMESHYKASSAPVLTMLAPNKREMPSDLKQGKYFAYKKSMLSPAQTNHTNIGKAYRRAGDPLRDHFGMSHADLPPVDRVGKVDPATAAAYHREPSWDANGDRVESCAEYAYERSYDVARFVDAATACRGDRECVFAVAYMSSTPGIADRKLVDTDGKELPKLTLAKGNFPKNDLFAFGPRFVRANGHKPMAATQEMLDLEAALQEGQTWYQIGSCTGSKCNTRKFRNEWTWHQHLHQANAGRSQAELEEYQARRAEFRALIEQWWAAVEKEHDLLMQEQVNDVVLPFDMRSHNPFDLFEIERQFIERSNTQIQQVKQRFGNDIVDMNLKDAMQQVVGGWTGGGSLALGVLASPSPQPAGTTPTTPQKNTSQTPTKKGSSMGVSPCARSDGWGMEMFDAGQISCRIGEFLRAEWTRKQAGHYSCLDLTNPGCDWTLSMFESAILDSVPLLDRQLEDERNCKAWQDGVTFPANTVSKAKQRLDANQAAFAEIWPLIKAYDQGTSSHGQKFGKVWAGGDYLGDKDWFAAGYDYSVGWGVEPQGQDGGIICRLGGSIHAFTGFDAWILGGKVEVVDGAIQAQSNAQNNGKVRFNAHLEMFDQSLFSTANEPDGWKVAQSFTSDPSSGFGISVPTIKPRFDIYVGVPVSGQLWGELLFGSSLTMSGKASSACTPANPAFAIQAGYMPFFAALGVGQVGVGISGIVSAGIRASLTLIMVGVPVDIGMKVQTKNGKQSLSFDSKVSLLLSTLAGRVSLYLEFLMFDEEWELFRWNGIGPLKATLMPKLTVDVPLAGMK